MNIVLLEPEIPQNTGNIVRTTVATASRLHLIKPLGFEISDKYLKRAGMDYFKDADISYYENLAEFMEKQKPERVIMATTKSTQIYTEMTYRADEYILFGKESKGIPEELLLEHQETCVRIPMQGDTRSLNLSNSVAIILYEALRQQGFESLSRQGKLHRLEWK